VTYFIVFYKNALKPANQPVMSKIVNYIQYLCKKNCSVYIRAVKLTH